MALKERLIQLTLKARDLFSGEVEKSASAVDELTAKAKELKEQLADTTRARGLARTLRDNEQAASGLERSLQDAQGNLADLTREIEQSENVTAGQTIALREAKRAVDEASRAYERNQRAITNVRSELKALGVNVDSDMTEAEQQLTAKLERNKRALDENREAIKRKREEEKAAADAANEHASRVAAAREAMSSGMRTVLGFAAAYVSLDAAIGLAQRGIDAIRAGIGNMLQAGDDAEALQARMTSLMGSIAAGEQATKWISEFAKQTPLATSEVADAFMLLKSYGLDPMDGTLQALVDKNEQLGGGMERLEGIVTAVGQAYAKSKLQAEEILQLVERGVPAWDMLARITGKNAAQLEQLASEGRLGRDVIKALVAELGKSANGAAAAGMSRLSGLMSQLADTAKDFYKRIAEAGALDFAKGKLQQLIDTIGQMDKDGRLDKLAKSLSDAFIQGAEKVEIFIKGLAGVDFKRLIDDGSAWLSSFGQQIDDAATRVQLFFAPFRTLFNWLGTGFNALALSFSGFVEGIVAGLQQVAKLVPDMLGGKELRAGLAEFRSAIDAMQDGFVAQIEQNNQDIRNAWDTTNAHLTKGSQDTAAAQVAAASEAKDAWQQAAEAGIVSNDAMRDAIVQAAIDGTNAIDDMAEALELIDTGNTVAQLEGLKAALFKAWQEGRISLEDYQAAHNATVEKIRALSAETAGAGDAMGAAAAEVRKLKAEQEALLEQYRAGSITLEDYQSRHNATAEAIRALSAETAGAGGAMGAAAEEVRKLKAEQAALLEQYRSGGITLEDYQKRHNEAAESIKRLGRSSVDAAAQVFDLEEKLGTLEKVQAAISSAKTDVDINNITAALRKLYGDGKITAAQYNEELQNVTARQKELKGAVEQTAQASKDAGEQLTKSQQMYNAALEDSILTNEELRRISGQRMEDERRASGELMEMQRKGQVVVQRDMSAMEGFFGGVLSRAREPLAAMSEAALEAFDRLSGISTVNLELDTSSLDATRDSLQRATAAMGEMQAAASGVGLSGLGEWMLKTQLQSQQIQVQYLKQKAALQELMEGYDDGSLQLDRFVSAAKGVRNNLSLLNDSDLRSLEASIASAEQRMRSLADSGRSALESVQDELDQLQGREDAVEGRRFARRRRDLEAQREEARAAGNDSAVADLSRALSLLRDLESETQQQRIVRDQQARQQQQQQAAPTAPKPAQQPATVIRLEAAGKRIDVSVPQGQQTQLLDILADSGLRTIS